MNSHACNLNENLYMHFLAIEVERKMYTGKDKSGPAVRALVTPRCAAFMCIAHTVASCSRVSFEVPDSRVTSPLAELSGTIDIVILTNCFVPPISRKSFNTRLLSISQRRAYPTFCPK